MRIAYLGTLPRASDARIQLSTFPWGSEVPPPLPSPKRPLPSDDQVESPSKRLHIHRSRPCTSAAAGSCEGGEWRGVDGEDSEQQVVGQQLIQQQIREQQRYEQQLREQQRHEQQLRQQQGSGQASHRGHRRLPSHTPVETRPRPPASACYVVDLGAVRVFPVTECSSIEPGDTDPRISSEAETETEENDSEGDSGDDSDVDHIDSSHARHRSRITSVAILLVFLLAPCFLIPFSIVYQGDPADSAPEPEAFEAVDWFHRAILMHVGLTVAVRIWLFGETHLEQPRWQCQPGLRPLDGHFFPIDEPLFPSFSPPPDSCPSSSADLNASFCSCPGYKPWETTSNGTYVDEKIFLHDVERVLYTTMLELQNIADHGPLDFRFTRGASTQFRWSTFHYDFIGSHASLPTIDTSLTNIFKTTTTVHGMGMMVSDSDDAQHNSDSTPTPTPTPTARPDSVFAIMHLDPPLEKLIGDIRNTFRAFKRLHFEEHYYLVLYHLKRGLLHLNATGILLRRLKRNASHEEQRHWGSDDDRFRCLYPPQTMTIDLTKPHDSSVSLPKLPRVTEIPQDEDIPEEFISAVFEAEYSRVLRSKSWDFSTPPLVTPCPTQFPSLEEWSADQRENETASALLEILNAALNFQFRDSSPFSDVRPQFHTITVIRDKLITLCDLFNECNDRIDQVVRALSPDEDEPYRHLTWNITVRDDVARLHDIAGFFRDIITVRLKEMRDRAKRSSWLIEELKRQQDERKEEIDLALARGWRGPRGQGLYIPPIHELLDDVDASYRWVEQEFDQVKQVKESRGRDFIRRRERLDNSEAGRPESKIIWSRWGLRDKRRDPEGTEALCWSLGPVNETYDEIVSFGRSAQWCGDAWGRHGYTNPRLFECKEHMGPYW
ncbi:hypothetical protein EDB81DRAFT_735884 [Dactylonectria macrodidyma]|uniref:Uncharacterized protein n=1 Tax=Dactylonectria macrodidyma TaxID=307937 RepID=A0A9P9D267_9HYPO|nr:hypothetical protein EDB81DRAFT_735884 [Dactylonectria macrodidyma]